MDHYYQHGKSDIMMKELIITFVTILLFGCCVAGYVQRSVQSDFAILYGSENNTVNREQVGWHNLTTDLFRTPKEPQALAILFGIGFQVLASVMVGLALITLFFSSSNFRPHIFVLSLIILAAFGYFNGFATSRLLRIFKAGDWKTAGVLSALIFSSYIMFVYGVSDIIELKARSSSGVSIASAFKYTFIWLMINVPLCLLGAKHGFTKELSVEPSVNEADKPIPQ